MPIRVAQPTLATSKEGPDGRPRKIIMNKEVTLVLPADKVKFKIDRIDNKITVVMIKIKPFDILTQISDKKIDEYMRINEEKSN